jgi:hypothetical protein
MRPDLPHRGMVGAGATLCGASHSPRGALHIVGGLEWAESVHCNADYAGLNPLNGKGN